MGVLQPPSSGAGAQMHVSEAGELGSRAARPALERHTTSVYKLLMAAAEGARSLSSVVVVVEHVLTRTLILAALARLVARLYQQRCNAAAPLL